MTKRKPDPEAEAWEKKRRLVREQLDDAENLLRAVYRLASEMGMDEQANKAISCLSILNPNE